MLVLQTRLHLSHRVSFLIFPRSSQTLHWGLRVVNLDAWTRSFLEGHVSRTGGTQNLTVVIYLLGHCLCNMVERNFLVRQNSIPGTRDSLWVVWTQFLFKKLVVFKKFLACLDLWQVLFMLSQYFWRFILFPLLIIYILLCLCA